MGKYYFRLLLLVSCVIGFFALIGSLLPRNYAVNSEICIRAPLSEVYQQFNRLENWKTWSPWNPAKIEGLTVECTGDQGVGNAMAWNDGRGEGKLWIIKTDPAGKIEYRMRFSNFPEMISSIDLTVQAVGDASRQDAEGAESPPTNAESTTAIEEVVIRWKSSGKLPGGPFYGYFAPFFGTHMKYEYDESLQRMKALLEQSATDADGQSQTEGVPAKEKNSES